MEIGTTDYFKVLGVSRSATKNDIVKAYRNIVQRIISDEDRKVYDRALLVLRISYLRYVYEKRGEAGLHEQRSRGVIERGCRAIAAALRSKNDMAISKQQATISCTSSTLCLDDSLQLLDSEEFFVDDRSTKAMQVSAWLDHVHQSCWGGL